MICPFYGNFLVLLSRTSRTASYATDYYVFSADAPSASNNYFFGSNLHPKRILLDSLVPKP